MGTAARYEDLSKEAMGMLTDIDRRTIGNLAIPRNVPNLSHELRVDPYSITRDDAGVYAHLLDLQELGFVHKLGTHEDPAKLAAHLPKRVRQMGDEQANIYATRMSSPRHAWRMDGDLWIITNEGIDALKAPTVEAPAKTSTELQAIVDAEWARTLKDPYVPGETDISNMLLQDEFMMFFRDTQEYCQKTWNKKLLPPVAGGVSGWPDTTENSLIDWENGKTTMPAIVDPWFMALTILAFTDTDTGTTADDGSHKPTYTGYARASTPAASLGTASAGSSSNTTAITFAACTASTSTILGFGNCSALTVGTLRKYGTCASTIISTTQTPATFAIGAYTTSAD